MVAMTVGWLERRSLATVDCGPWLEQVPFDPTTVMVPLVRVKVGRFQNTYFKTNCQNFDSGVEPNEALFSSKSLILLIVVKNYFQRYIICLSLESFAQIHVFRDN